eukprot:g2648.t1
MSTRSDAKGPASGGKVSQSRSAAPTSDTISLDSGLSSVSETLAANSISTPGSAESCESLSKRRRMTSPEKDFTGERSKTTSSSDPSSKSHSAKTFPKTKQHDANNTNATTTITSSSSKKGRDLGSATESLLNSRVRRCTDTHEFNIAGTIFEIDTKYDPIKSIGTGAYGIVIACMDKGLGEKVAIKKIPGAFNDIIEAKRVVREVKLLLSFDHDNLMSAIEVLRPPLSSKNKDIYIVSPLMETDLHRIIYSKQDLSDDHTQYFIYQILRALKYMHSAHVLHRDLKPSNLLLNSNCDLKVCDFGLSRGLYEQSDLTEYVVTRWYRAPEIMLSCQQYSKAVDVWSVGCIMAELIARKPLFPGDDYIHQLQLITRKLGTPAKEDMSFIRSDRARRFMSHLPYSPKVSWSEVFDGANPLALDLLDKMLMFNPAKRITVADALKHKYLQTLHCEEDEPVANFKFDFGFDAKITSTKEAREALFNAAIDGVRSRESQRATEKKTKAGA